MLLDDTMPAHLSTDLGAAAANVAVDTVTDDDTMPAQLSTDLGAAAHAAAIAAANVGVAHDAQGQSIEQQLAEINQTTPYGTPVDSGQAAQEANLQAAYAATMNAVENPNDGAAQAAAHAAEDALAGDIDEGGLGSFSPAVMWGINSEMGTATMSDLMALNAQDAQGYAITNTTPTAASLRASNVFADLNPTITNAIIGIIGLMPGPIGFGAFLAGLMSNKGLMNIPAVQAIPGIKALSDIVNIPQDLLSKVTGSFTEQLGEALEKGLDSLPETLGDDADFDETDEGYGGGTDIDIVPPVTTPVDDDREPLVKKPYIRATPANVMARILAARKTGADAVARQRAGTA